jgi:hypothetical protein
MIGAGANRGEHVSAYHRHRFNRAMSIACSEFTIVVVAPTVRGTIQRHAAVVSATDI